MGAGRGQRLGRGPKAFVRHADGPTFLEVVVARLTEAGIRRIVAVLPAPPDPVAVPAEVAIVRNLDPETGPLQSTILGLRALEGGDLDLLILHPVDHPEVTVGDISALVGAVATAGPGHARIAPEHRGRPGHPIAVIGPGITALAALSSEGDRTLDGVLSAAGATLPVPASAAVLKNINTPPGMA